MSLQTDRQALADLLSTAPGVTGHPYPPAAPAAGDAWPRLPSLAREHGLVWRPTWKIIVGLSFDEREASAWVDEHFGDLVAALDAGRCQVDAAEPAVMGTDAGDLLVLEVTLRSY